MRRIFLTTAMAVLMALAAPLASADDELAVPAAANRPVTVGAAVVYKDKPYRGYDDDEKAAFLPLVLFEGERFFVRGTSLGWKFVNTKPWEVAVTGEFWGDGYDNDDANILDGMDNRDPSFAVGGHVTWKPQKFGLSVSAESEVTGNSDGTQVKGTAFYDNRVGNWFYRGSAGVIWNNEDYIDYYYGVQNDEVDLNLGRTAYEGDDETWVRLGLVLGYQRPESKWMFLVGGRYDIMGDEVDDSPITSDDKMFMGFAGFGYSFGK
jgi:outer membrane scaffolding protein for murein synthesis (MipA/OmpV family)